MPAPQSPRLTALRVLDPEGFRARVRAALRSAGSVPGAALDLGTSTPTLWRWLAEDPSLREGLELKGRGRKKGR